nr:lysozyme [Bordetella genomosp. 1]
MADNLGVKAFSLSKLTRPVNAGQASEGTDQFPSWDKAAGKSMRGRRRRRASEQALFLGFGIAQALQIEDKTA